MQITIGPGEAITIILAVISGVAWLIHSQAKLRETMVRVSLTLEGLSTLPERVRQIELAQASQDPHRGRRMHPLSRSVQQHQDEEEA